VATEDPITSQTRRYTAMRLPGEMQSTLE